MKKGKGNLGSRQNILKNSQRKHNRLLKIQEQKRNYDHKGYDGHEGCDEEDE